MIYFYRLSHKSLNFLVEIANKHHNFGLVIYAIPVKNRGQHV